MRVKEENLRYKKILINIQSMKPRLPKHFPLVIQLSYEMWDKGWYGHCGNQSGEFSKTENKCTR